MAETDKYLTLEKLSEGVYKDKGSRFYSFVFPVSSVDEAKKILDEYRKKYHDARHVCYAYVVGKTDEDSVTRSSDDGEPSGTAGKPMLTQLVSNGLHDVMAVVVRYFGGVLLGTGGLVVAYRSAVEDALQNATVVERIVEDEITVDFEYEKMNAVMKVVKDNSLKIVSQKFDLNCSITVLVPKSKTQQVKSKLGIE
ncbi:MAG: YigZ family protein [Paludibacteraceae bacterium]|nr:YigZ family protein [Paludibacteraceae bacterium]MBP5136039.1 YigZ family protein [Paludibacteraceae bacterium]MBP5742322.1 YigZ family protein [Paludibacteraceae bacterium]